LRRLAQPRKLGRRRARRIAALQHVALAGRRRVVALRRLDRRVDGRLDRRLDLRLDLRLAQRLALAEALHGDEQERAACEAGSEGKGPGGHGCGAS
jgi:hypothetical protein